VVLKRLSLIGEALSHTSLAGVAAGLLLGVNPVAAAIVVSMSAALGVEAVRRKLPAYSELSVALVLCAGVGVAGVLSGYVTNPGAFNGFLFGSFSTVDNFELGLVAATALLVLAVFLLLYKELFALAFDERLAKLAGVRVGLCNTVFTLLTALTVSVAARTVGALVVSSLMIIPVACAMRVAKSYRASLLWAVAFAMLFTVFGLTFSFYAGSRPGATISLTGCIALVALLVFKPGSKG
jgi:zinc transport system permease protein